MALLCNGLQVSTCLVLFGKLSLESSCSSFSALTTFNPHKGEHCPWQFLHRLLTIFLALIPEELQVVGS